MRLNYDDAALVQPSRRVHDLLLVSGDEYLDRTRDSPPGNMVLWRGMARLTDIHLGYYSLAKDVGN